MTGPPPQVEKPWWVTLPSSPEYEQLHYVREGPPSFPREIVNERGNKIRRVAISALAVMKMAAHAFEGGDREVMGKCKGTVLARGDGTYEMVILDVITLPVIGEQAFIELDDRALTYETEMGDELAAGHTRGPDDDPIACEVAWYHTHPGYGTFLSDTDVLTEQQYQAFNTNIPYCAIVLDPFESRRAGRPHIGAFRTVPVDARLTSDETKALERDLHGKGPNGLNGLAKSLYWEVPVSYFAREADVAALDVLWARYWSAPLSADAMLGTVAFTHDAVRSMESLLQDSDAAGRGGVSGERDAKLDDARAVRV